MSDPVVSQLTGVDQRSVHRAVDRAVDRFIAHNVEPPVHHVQALKVNKPTTLAVTGKKKTEVDRQKKKKNPDA
jgi:hypothetical protein